MIFLQHPSDAPSVPTPFLRAQTCRTLFLSDTDPLDAPGVLARKSPSTGYHEFLLGMTPNGVRAHIQFTRQDPIPHSCRLVQEHTAIVVQASHSPVRADAHWTMQPKGALGAESAVLAIRTADCLPVCCWLEHKGMVFWSNTHAGWRGFAAGIHFEVLRTLISFGKTRGLTSLETLAKAHVFIGPALFGTHFEVGEEVDSALQARFRTRPAQALFALMPPENQHKDSITFQEMSVLDVASAGLLEAPPAAGKTHPDLQLLMCLDLLALGVASDNIWIYRKNTYLSPLFPSHRASTHGHLPPGNRFVTHLAMGTQTRWPDT